jgi:hypothetical protein
MPQPPPGHAPGPASQGVLITWGVLAVLGTIGIVYVASYIETLTELGRTDRDAAAALFRTRVLPVLWIVALLALTAGTILSRQGLRLLRSGAGGQRHRPVRPGTAGQAIGMVFTVAGAAMAILPLLGVCYLTWLVW